MANHASHAALPYPIKGARFTVLVPLLDADGDPTAQTTPDTEVSEDNAAATDAAEEVSATSGMDGMGMITLTGAETDCSCLAVNFKAASGPKATLMTLFPRVLAEVGTGTLSAGSAGGGTLGTLLAYDVTGCFIKTTGGTGGGGTGGANNQVRKIVTYNTSTGAFTVTPNWETTPSTDTTYAVLLPEGVTLGMLKALNSTSPIQTAGDGVAAVTSGTHGNAALKTLIDAVDDFIDTEVAAIKAKTDNLPSDPADASDIAASFSTVNTKLDTIDDFLDTEIAAIKAKTDNLPADPADASDIASSFTTVNGKLDTIDDFLDTEIAAIKAKTDNLPSDPADASDIVSAFSTVNSTLATIAAYIDTEVASILAAVDTEVAAIKAKTDNLPASPAAVGSAMTLTSGERESIAAAHLDLAAGVETGLTVRQAMRLVAAAAAGKLSGAGTTTVVVRNAVADSKNRITATVDDDGNRSAVSVDLT
jgi:hypothetical protein